jgi:ABC-2 type transport system ATP-binding protein
MTAISTSAAQTTAAAVAMHGVTFSYGKTLAVDHLDLDVARGEVLTLLGPNGAGKSTSISLMLGLHSPDQGSVRLFGQRPGAAVRAGQVAAMLQENQLLPRATVGELLRFTHGLYPNAMPVGEVAALADITELQKRTTDRLSGGQAQRVRFAMAIIGQPTLLVLDEPTAALDVEARREFWTAIDGYADGGRAVLFSTHYLEEADEHAQRVVVIAGGRKMADGTPEQIRQKVPGRTVTIDAPGDRAADALAGLPGVSSVKIDRGRAHLRCTESDRTVAVLAQRGLVRNLEVTGSKLEDAFLSITHAAKDGE